MFRRYILPWLVWILYRTWSWTWTIEVTEHEELSALKTQNQPIVFAHWHGDELAVLPLIRAYKIATMTSTSADGALIDFVVKRLGGATSRGSSTRGGVGALIGLMRLMREGYRASIAVDGPKGPIHQVKPGVFELAWKTEAHIVPVGAAMSRAFIFKKSWNKAQLPWPFSTIHIVFAKPLPLLAGKHETKSLEKAHEVRAQIFYASQQAAQTIAGNKTRC